MSDNTPGGSVPPNDRPDVGRPTPPPPPPAAPGGGYGPPAGGYPPPSGGYGTPPGGYPPAPGGFGQAPGSGGADVVMDGVKYGWKKFTENVGPFLIGGLIWFAGLALVLGLFYTLLIVGAALGSDSGSSAGLGLGFGVSTLVFVAIATLLGAFLQAAFYNASLKVAAGQKLEVNDFFKLPNLGQALGTAILVGIATGIGYFLFVLPGIAVMIFSIFAIVIALDRGVGPVDAIKASVELVRANLVPVLLLALAVYILSSIGSFVCGVGILATFPIGTLAVVFVYRKLQHQNVAA